MKKSLMLTCFGFAGWGAAMTIIQVDGACVNLWVKLSIFVLGIAFYLYITMTHLQKLKDFIADHEAKPPMFDFEKEKTEQL